MNFRTPIVVEPGVLGRYRILTGPADALDALCGRWPETDSPRYQKALRMCRQALNGEIKASSARPSVVAAARLAGVLISEDVSRRYTIGSVDLATEGPEPT